MPLGKLSNVTKTSKPVNDAVYVHVLVAGFVACKERYCFAFLYEVCFIFVTEIDRFLAVSCNTDHANNCSKAIFQVAFNK